MNSAFAFPCLGVCARLHNKLISNIQDQFVIQAISINVFKELFLFRSPELISTDMIRRQNGRTLRSPQRSIGVREDLG